MSKQREKKKKTKPKLVNIYLSRPLADFPRFLNFPSPPPLQKTHSCVKEDEEKLKTMQINRANRKPAFFRPPPPLTGGNLFSLGRASRKWRMIRFCPSPKPATGTVDLNAISRLYI